MGDEAGAGTATGGQPSDGVPWAVGRGLLENAVEGIYVTSVDGQYLWANPALLRLYGFDNLAELQQHVTDIATRVYVSPQRRQEFLDEIGRRGYVTEFQSEAYRKDGSRIWVSENSRAVHDSSGRLTSFEGFVTDITARRRAEQELAYRLRFEAVLASLSSEFVRLAADDLEQAIQRSLARVGGFLGVDRVVLLMNLLPGRQLLATHEWRTAAGPGWRQVQVEQSRTELPLLWRRVQQNQPLTCLHLDQLPSEAAAEAALAAALGSQAFLAMPMVCAGEAIGAVVLAAAGERSWPADALALSRMLAEIIAAAIYRARSFDRERLLERQVLHTQKLESLGILAGGIAHDFNNLLLGVIGNADLALGEVQRGGDPTTHLSRIRETAQRTAELTNQLLAYSGKGRFVLEPVDLSAVVAQMADLLQVSVTRRGTLRLDLPSDLPAIEADATQLRQVVMNLITNASDALGDGTGQILLRCGMGQAADLAASPGDLLGELPHGPVVWLEVIDTGGGMDPSTQARIFEPFFTTKFTGRGLGLAAVLGIVRGHGGAIVVDSAVGTGTTMRVVFPVVPGVVARPAAEIAVPVASPATGTVLFVDDHEVVREVAQQVLSEAGFEVLLAVDGLDALRLFDEQGARVDLVVLDLTMPNLAGEDTFHELRRRRADLPILLSSGYSEHDALARFAGAGLAGFLQKPYRPAQLIWQIQQALLRARQVTG
ncbi:MAG: response regulator [Fimbriimonadaceae bacterium]|nr:response regulator [Fimbriimonadaceae bacterium]